MKIMSSSILYFIYIYRAGTSDCCQLLRNCEELWGIRLDEYWLVLLVIAAAVLRLWHSVLSAVSQFLLLIAMLFHILPLEVFCADDPQLAGLRWHPLTSSLNKKKCISFLFDICLNNCYNKSCVLEFFIRDTLRNRSEFSIIFKLISVISF